MRLSQHHNLLLLLVFVLLGEGLAQVFLPQNPYQPEVAGQLQAMSAGVPIQMSQTGSSFSGPAGLQLVTPDQGFLNVQAGVGQRPVRRLNWRFPAPPVVPRPPVMQSSPPLQEPPRSVAAVCTEKVVHVEVNKDLFGTGHPIEISALSLGGCPPVAEDPALHILIFQSELQNCGSNVIVTEDELVYVFTLIYSSPKTTSLIMRSIIDAGATVLIECHYPRFHNVSSNPLVPFWIPHVSLHVTEEQLVFSLRLMMDDWMSERASNQYALGDTINIEASVVQFNHIPLRVTVESCVATSVPDLNAVPRYFFIENHGCFVDAKLTGSKSRFMPQIVSNKLGFQLEAFRFQNANTSRIFFACLLKATADSFAPTAETKACSFSGNGWFAAYGGDAVCSCCDGICGARKRRDFSDYGLHTRTVHLGPLVVEE